MLRPFAVIPRVMLGKAAASLGLMLTQPPLSSDLLPDDAPQ